MILYFFDKGGIFVKNYKKLIKKSYSFVIIPLILGIILSGSYNLFQEWDVSGKEFKAHSVVQTGGDDEIWPIPANSK